MGTHALQLRKQFCIDVNFLILIFYCGLVREWPYFQETHIEVYRGKAAQMFATYTYFILKILSMSVYMYVCVCVYRQRI